MELNFYRSSQSNVRTARHRPVTRLAVALMIAGPSDDSTTAR
jgi:hypothetical protein